MIPQTLLVACYDRLGQPDEALRICRSIYADHKALVGLARRSRTDREAMRVMNRDTIQRGSNLSIVLLRNGLYAEAEQVARETLGMARGENGQGALDTVKTIHFLGQILYRNPSASRNASREAVALLEEAATIARRALGPHHPETSIIVAALAEAREVLASHEP